MPRDIDGAKNKKVNQQQEEQHRNCLLLLLLSSGVCARAHLLALFTSLSTHVPHRYYFYTVSLFIIIAVVVVVGGCVTVGYGVLYTRRARTQNVACNALCCLVY